MMLVVEMEAYIGEDWPRRLKRIGHSYDSYAWALDAEKLWC